jgi:UDP-GlcNAc:undecaprenyl-phosphate/decaprenyl-phosphate GlcNAc-1-phosphate transferase
MLIILTPLLFLFGDFSPLLEKRLLIVLIIGIGISLVSFVDDLDTIGKSWIRVPPLVRLLMQIGVGAVIGLTSIKITYMSGLFGDIINLDNYSTIFLGYQIWYIPVLVTIFWYVLVFNSVNFSDGVPGLTGGFALISFVILGLLAVKLLITDTTIASQENSRFLLAILAVIIPITYFLTRADISRHVIMGDSGTIMLAFLLATLAIIGGGKIATALSVLGIYVIDFVYVVTSRLLAGKNPMKWDQSTHLHFRLMELGLSQSQIRTIVYTLTIVFGVSAILLSSVGKVILLICIAVITIFLTEILAKVRKK